MRIMVMIRLAYDKRNQRPVADYHPTSFPQNYPTKNVMILTALLLGAIVLIGMKYEL